MKVLLLRHAMTAGNALHRYIGRTDEPLSPEGIEAAKAVKAECEQAANQQAANEQNARYNPSTVYVTPLKRTGQTASILFPNARQIVIEDLREMDFGNFENRSAEDMISDNAYQDWVAGNCLGQCPHGESTQAFMQRVQTAFAETVSACMNSSQVQSTDTVVFVVHGGTIMAVLAGFAHPSMHFYDGITKNCQGFLCTVSPQTDTVADSTLNTFLLTNVTKVDRIIL